MVEGWGELPDGWSFGHVIGVDVDREDNVYVLNRGEHPVIIFNAMGDFIDS